MSSTWASLNSPQIRSQRPSGTCTPRPAELGQAGLVLRDDSDAYQLTELGGALGAALKPLDVRARRWSQEQAE
jgi:hypothetical protein